MLMRREDFMSKHPGLTEGATVYAMDGEKLGKVTELGSDSFLVEKGMFFPKDFMVRYDDIQDVRDGEVHLNLAKNDLADWKDESYLGWSQVDDINAGRVQPEPREDFRDRFNAISEQPASHDTMRIPVAEEKLEAQKVQRETGQVRIRKVVHTELRHLTVPVMREEVRIERVPVDSTSMSGTDANVSKDAFTDKTITVPVMEEEVVISTRPVVKEEIQVSKERHIEENQVSEEVQREDVQIDDETLKRRKAA